MAFNKKPEKAIQEYINKGVLKDDPRKIAERLNKTEGINKITMG